MGMIAKIFVLAKDFHHYSAEMFHDHET